MKRRTYTEKEIEYIKKNYAQKNNNELASHLNRSAMSIAICLNKLGIWRTLEQKRKINENKGKNSKILEYLRNNVNEKSNAELAKKIGFTTNQVIYYLFKYQIKRDKNVIKELRKVWQKKSVESRNSKKVS